MEMIKLKPAFKDYLWGGTRLKKEYGMKTELDIVAEAWELSAHPDGPARITNGKYVGKNFIEYLDIVGKKAWGTNAQHFEQFPILIKFIDAKQALSIQVHPNDEYALQVEKEYGKNEMWYIVDCEPGSYLYYGVNQDLTKEEYRKHIEDDTILEVLNKVEVKKGDCFFIKAGTIHAIGEGCLICEIQQ
ncbi:MAG: type I phosphomannose isomerase catalytic subunit, partial [Erysipelotrichaceae bacterium]